MPSPLRVLIAIDGSDTALAAARCWADWQGGAERPLHALLLAVAPPLPHAWQMADSEAGAFERALTQVGEPQLAEARELFAGSPVTWEAAARIGEPAATIVAEAQRQRADLIVLGTRGLTPLAGLLLGSVALRVTQTSTVPVWLAPPQAPCPQALGQRLRLLVAVDASPSALVAAQWAAHHALRFGEVELELVAVQPPIAPLPAAGGAAWRERIGQTALDAVRAALPPTGARVESRLCTGETVATLLARADETGADAIVVGPRGLGAVGQALLGSVTSALLQTSRRPLIVVGSG
jgi:nucleotide-binding universal stress UspA family protein